MDGVHLPGAALRKGGRARLIGFTLIELLVVMAILATLLAIAAPRYFESVDKAKETALRSDLRVMREAIDKHLGDTGHLPDSLQALVTMKYLRAIPIDPITDSVDDWVIVAHPDGQTPGIYNVRSGAPGAGRDGSAYATW